MLLRRAVAARLLCSGLASCIGPGCPSVLVPFCCCALLPVSSRPLSTAAGVLRSYASRREREGGAGSRRPHPLPTGALVDVYALNGQLSAAATGDELLALVEARAAAMNDVNAATALTRLAKLPGSWKDDPRTQKLCILAGDKVAEMGARTLANTLWAVAKLALPRPPWLKQWLAASLIQLRYMNPQELSNTLYALGEFGAQHGDGEWTTAFWSASSRQLGAFQPQALSNTLAACVKLNLRPSVAWRARYLDASLRTLSAYTTQNLSNSILALSDLDARPGRAWMTAWAARAAAALPLFNEQEACNSLLALVQLGAYDSVALSPLWARVQQLLGPRSRTEHLHSACGAGGGWTASWGLG